MITGGVLDAKEKGVPGELKMAPEMVKAVCNRAHALGYQVAAHVESPQGVRVALENGVDSIEHGAKMDDDMIRLFKEKNAFLCTTLSPALPYALFDRSITNATEVEQFNGNVFFEGIIYMGDCRIDTLCCDRYRTCHVPTRYRDSLVCGKDSLAGLFTGFDFIAQPCIESAKTTDRADRGNAA